MSEARPVQVVVAYDFSPSAEAALARAVDVAARAPQHVLHIVAALEPHVGIGHGAATYRTADEVRDVIVRRAKSAFDGRDTASEIQFFVHTRIGRPDEEILGLAAEVGADLIFIGSHGKTGLERVLLGSVSEKVVREAKCPVMVVRAKGYPEVDLLKVFRFEHERKHFTAPHRYSYIETRVITRPPDWPLV
ncbi:MAG TPA: universal stress protein [Kofleriaceae bacterium]|nr:universal stress protein [Kofleriaceae bacterium]